MRPLRLLALASGAAALQFSPVKPLRRRALQRRIRREADFISSPARGMDPEVLIQDDDALDDLARKHNNLVEELRNLDEPARPRTTAAVAGPNAHRIPINKVEPRFGSALMAYAWYRSEPLPGFSGQTAMQLVRDGRAGEVIDFIDAVDAGVYA